MWEELKRNKFVLGCIKNLEFGENIYTILGKKKERGILGNKNGLE